MPSPEVSYILIFIYIFLGVFSSCLTKNKYSTSDERITMKRRILFTIVSALLLIALTINASAREEQFTWFIKRNGQKTPGFSSKAAIVDRYNGYYIDQEAAQKDDKILYLTFDAGYENGNIESILDILKAEKIQAAFFILDNLILKNTDLVKRMADEGHLVCNHTKNHKNLSNSSSEEIIKNLTDLEKLYEEKTGKQLDKYFRFPEGNFSENSLKVICDMGYKTIFWSFAYDDWDNSRQPNCEAAKRKILTNTHSGAIILLHPTSNTNVAILPDLIASWRQMGYRFGTLCDLTK